MIKTNIKKIVLSIVLFATPLMADYEFQTKSLIGIEGGYSSLGYEDGTTFNNVQGTTDLNNLGLKLGAETEDFRAFLSARYFHDASNKYDYLATAGLEIQYMFNVSKFFNIYLGANGGYAEIKFRSDTETFSRTITNPYYGGDIGTNIHLGDSVDVELGGRIMSIQGSNTMANRTYKIESVINAYASLIFKWQMD